MKIATVTIDVEFDDSAEDDLIAEWIGFQFRAMRTLAQDGQTPRFATEDITIIMGRRE